MDKNGVKEYQTEDLIIYWNPSICYHASECWHRLPQVFKPAERPWIRMANATPEEIIKTIDQCPSGALTYKLPTSSKVDPAVAQGPGSATD